MFLHQCYEAIVSGSNSEAAINFVKVVAVFPLFLFASARIHLCGLRLEVGERNVWGSLCSLIIHTHNNSQKN